MSTTPTTTQQAAALLRAELTTIQARAEALAQFINDLETLSGVETKTVRTTKAPTDKRTKAYRVWAAKNN